MKHFISTLVMLTLYQVHSWELFTGPGPLETDIPELDQVFVRTEQLPNNRKLVIMANPDKLVQFHYLDDFLVDCIARRRVDFLLENLVSESDWAEETLHLPENIQYIETETDLGWFGRFCRKFIRDKLRDAEYFEIADEEKYLVKEIVDRKWLEKGLEGTNFCKMSVGKGSLSVSLYEENGGGLGSQREIDQCCKLQFECDEEVIKPVHILNTTLNADTIPVYSCDCMQKYFNCLDSVQEQNQKELGIRMKDIWRKIGRCYSKSERLTCKKESLLFDRCEEMKIESVPRIKMIDF